MRISTALLLLGACKTNLPHQGSGPMCSTFGITPTGEDEDAFEEMVTEATGTWAIPWENAPATFGNTFELSGGVILEELVIQEEGWDGTQCVETTPQRVVLVEDAILTADWLGSARTTETFALRAARTESAALILTGDVDIDAPNAVFDAAIQEVTRGAPADTLSWSFFYGSNIDVRYETGDSQVASMVARCEAPCDIEPL